MIEADTQESVTASASAAKPATLLHRAPRAALAVFVAVEAAAAVLFLRAGRDQWFYLDEWDFLANRNVSDPASLFRPHFEHWTTLPILVYRALWTVFGLRTYIPYLVVAIAVHLAVAALLRVVMRRAGVGPWIATVVASIVALLGTGNENVIFGFQITFTGALAFGLVQLLLAAHDGPADRRDLFALAAGLAAIMCSGPGLVMVCAAGVATFLRRGVKAGAIQTVPLFVIYGIWALVFGESSQFSEGDTFRLKSVGGFVWRGLAAAFGAIGQLSFVGWILVAVLVAGVVVGATTRGWRSSARAAAVPIGLAFGVLLFLAVTAWGRAAHYGSVHATEKRYIYMVAAMLAPLLAVACSALTDRWPKASPIVLVILVLGVPGNIRAADDRELFEKGDKTFALTLPLVEQAQQAPDAKPAGLLEEADIPVSWFTRGVEEGRIPAPNPRTPSADARARITIALQPSDGGDAPSNCVRVRRSIPVDLVPGQRIEVREGSVRVSDATTKPPLFVTVFTKGFNGSLVAVAEVPTSWSPYDPAAPPLVCGLAPR